MKTTHSKATSLAAPAFRPLKAALAVAMAFGMPMALAQQSSAPLADESGPAVGGDGLAVAQTELGTITVNASADASAAGLSKPVAGGQTARGGRVGILGTRDQMDVPVSVTSYTNQLIQDQQARSVGEVLENDPSIRLARGFGNFQETYYFRGFLLSSDDLAYNGLYGLLPRQYVPTELVERVETLHGASAFLTGATPSGTGLGGTVNLLPKRAPAEAFNRVEAGVLHNRQFNVEADLARRFGPDGNTGLRLTANHRQGDTAVDEENEKLGLFSAAIDWRNSHTRLSADLAHQNHRLKATRPNVTLAPVNAASGTGVTVVPDAPDNTLNWAQPWTYSKEKDLFGSLRGEHDFNDTLTGWFGLGIRRSDEDNRLANLTVTQNDGTGTAYRFDNLREDSVTTGEIGMRAQFATGPVKHEAVVSASAYQLEVKNAYAMDFANTFATSLRNPVQHAMPAFGANTFYGNWASGPALQRETRLTSVAIGDTLSMLDDTLRITLGLRHQKLKYDSYSYASATAAGGQPQSAYDDSRVSPMAGVVYKLPNRVSLYANYIEGLSQGEEASGTQANGQRVLNFGEALKPYVAKQKEIGAKWDSGTAIYGMALFSTDRPRGIVNSAGYFTDEGKDRHRGAEFTVQGEPLRGLRVLGGITFLDAKQVNTGNSTTDGKRVIGVPKQQMSLAIDWDTPWVEGLSADARLITTGTRYADSANTLKVGSWARVDLGMRYLVDVQGKLVTLRARIDNLTDRNYWASSGGYPDNGYLVAGAPRTFSLSASVEF